MRAAESGMQMRAIAKISNRIVAIELTEHRFILGW
jgi:hypothetical protein